MLFNVSKKKHFGVLALLAVINFIFYFFNLNNFFVSDDFDWIQLTRSATQPLYHYFTANYYGGNLGGSYRPLINVFFWLDNKIWGLNPIGYHLTNLILCILSAWLIYLIVLKLFKNHIYKEWLATLSAVFFSLMPSHAEVVIWISGRCDAACTLFYLLAFYLYLIFKDQGKIKYLIISVGSFILALLSKEMAITLPLLILFYEAILLVREKRWKLKSILKSLGLGFIYAVPLIIFFVVRFYAIGIVVGYYQQNASFEFFWPRIYTMFLNLFSDTFLFLAPRLAFVRFFQGKDLAFFGMIAVIILGFIIFVRKYCKELILLFLAYIILILPVVNLIFGMLNDEGERYDFLPSAITCIVLAILILYLKEKWGSRVFYPVLILVLIYFGYFTVQKSLIWNRASLISQSIVADVKDLVNLNNGTKEGVVAFGLPDNYQGAPIMRNGFKQAASLYYPQYKMDAIVVNQYVYLNSENYDKNNIAWQKTTDGFMGQAIGGKFILTGLAAEDNDDLDAELKNYNISDDTANGISLTFKDKFLAQLPSKKIYFLTFDKGRIMNLNWQ